MRYALITFCFMLSSCFRIPVTVHPPHDDAGLPQALPVTPTGHIGQDGTIAPVFPVSISAPKPAPSIDWESLLSILLGVAGVGGPAAALGAFSIARKAKIALKIAADLADKNAEAETEEEIARNKHEAAVKQAQEGVLKLTKKVRGK